MKPFVILCILGVARTGGSIDTRDAQSAEKQVDFVSNERLNKYGFPSEIELRSEPRFDNPFEVSDANRFITLAFINMSWLEDGELRWTEDRQERSKYGMGRVMDVEGRLVHVTDANNEKDHSACNSSLRDSSGIPLDEIPTPWIALIRRGRCDFEKKIWNVFKAKASGVIIYNNITGSELNYMKITKDELLKGNITSVFTTMNKGMELASKLENNEHVFVSLKAGARFDKKSSLNHRSSVLFVTISFIIVMVISMLWLIVYYYQRFRYLQTKENEQKMDTNKAKEALKKIPTKTIKTMSKVRYFESMEKNLVFNKQFTFPRNSRATVVLCVSKLTGSTMCYGLFHASEFCCLSKKNEPNNSISRLARHEFHKNCIDPWLLEHHTCPLCKARVLKQFGYVVSEDGPSDV